jgi:quercetin dioxygenase-like cupin family protein
MKAIVSVITASAILFGGSVATVQAQSGNHVIQTAKEAQWGPAPPMLPAGAQIALLAGDPTKPVLYTIRLKFPANYSIPAHSHPTDEHVVVLSGALTFGMGDALTKGAGSNKTLAAGGFALMPANMNHFAYTASQETTIVLYGQGPVEFKYVNPADDPRTAKKGTK